jgi:polyamine oxidase
MQMGTYTKIFFQFPPSADGTYFWDSSSLGTQFFLYADPIERGWYPVFQSLTAPDFIPESGIFFVTIVYSQSYRAEQQADDVTKDEVLKVLRSMFGEGNVPDPLDFMYPRWSLEPWAMGSYSNWPAGMSIETHQNLRANLGRLWFAGEANSVEYYGFLQGMPLSYPFPFPPETVLLTK